MMATCYNSTFMNVFPLLVSLALSGAQDDAREHLRAKQAEVRALLDRVERLMGDLGARLQKKDPEASGKIQRAWSTMRQTAVQKDMDEVQSRIAAGRLVDAIAKTDEVISKLNEVLKMLLGAIEAEPKSRLAELKREIDEILKEQIETKRGLDEIRRKSSDPAADLAAAIQREIEAEQNLQKEAAQIPPADVAELLKEALEEIRKTDASLGAAKTAEDDRRVAAAAQEISAKLQKPFELLHPYGQDLGHKLQAAREQLDFASKDTTQGASEEAPKRQRFQRSAGEHLANAAREIQEILSALGEREKVAPEVARKQNDVQNEIGQARDKAAADPAQPFQKASEALKRAAEAARASARKAEERRGAESRAEAAAAEKALREALSAIDEAERSRQAKVAPNTLEPSEKRQSDLASRTAKAASELAEAPAGKSLQDARAAMAKAAEKIAPRDPSARDLPEASAHQQRAIDRLLEARNALEEKAREEALGTLEKEILYMIEEQKKINKTTLDLDGRKKLMGELTREEKFKSLIPASQSERELVSHALKAGAVAGGAGAPAMAAVFADVGQEMSHVSTLLADDKTGPLTQRKEQYILQTLEDLLRAVREAQERAKDQARNQEAERNEKPEEDTKPKPEEANREILSVEAELRLLIEMERHISEQNKELGRASAGRDELGPLYREIVKDLAARQASVTDRLKHVTARVEQEER